MNTITSTAYNVYERAKNIMVQQQQQQQPQVDQESKQSKLRPFLDFCVNHPKLSTAVAVPLALATVKYIAKYIAKRYKKDTVLEIDFTQILLTEKPLSSIEKIFEKKKVWFREVIEALDYAANDPKIIGLVAKVGGGTNSGLAELGLGHTDELRSAIQNFSKNKLSVCYCDSIGDAGNANQATREYYLISAFRKVHVAPLGTVVVPGLMLNGLFVKNTLSKLEIEAQLVHREEYKTATNMFTHDKFDEYHKEQVEGIMNGVLATIVDSIAASRKVSQETVKEWFEKGVYTPNEALEANIIDGVGFRDEVYGGVASTLNLKEPNYLFLSAYYQKRGRMYEKGNKEVALIHAVGPIVRGEEEKSLTGGSSNMIYSETVARNIRNARKDKNVKAIILRVDSPGGDAIASDIINREIVLARKDGKKVIISMASVAASGGYWISMNADRIVCNPLAITGSIGVIFGKFLTRQFFENKLGVTFDDVKTNERATLFSSTHSFDDDQWNVINKLIDFYYDKFKEGVATGRKMELQQVAQLAKGQVYTGRRGKEIGLVDRVGGLNEAIQDAKELIGFDEKKDKLKLTVYPKEKNIMQLLSARSAQNSEQRDKNVSVPYSLSLQPQSGSLALMNTFKTIWSAFMQHNGINATLSHSASQLLAATTTTTTGNSTDACTVPLQNPLVEMLCKL